MSAGGDEDATGPSLAGFLLKHPGKGLFRKYKKRWFALGNLSLSYAKTEGGPPLRTIRCRDVISCTGIPGIPVKAKAAHDGLGIALHFEDRAIVLLAPDPIAREQWIQAIGIAQKIDNGEMAAAPPSAAPPPPAVSAHPPSASPPADSPSPASSAPPASSRRGGDAGAGSGSGSWVPAIFSSRYSAVILSRVLEATFALVILNSLALARTSLLGIPTFLAIS